MARVLPAVAASIPAAAEVFRTGGIVIFPTETVYGIGADLHNSEGVRRLFAVKLRAINQPLLVHCCNMRQLAELVTDVPVFARRLMHRFWPGPLSLVFKKHPSVPTLVTAGRDTVGIRMVAHDFTCAVIGQLNSPIAGTSANYSGRPATACFCRLDPDIVNQVDLAIDAGECGTGFPSTVLDVSVDPPVLIREGAVSLSELAPYLGSRTVRQNQARPAEP
ncbi:MAG: L-threonylcarbamoyladenylate synthase [candidate division WOR-3 bacterium]